MLSAVHWSRQHRGAAATGDGLRHAKNKSKFTFLLILDIVLNRVYRHLQVLPRRRQGDDTWIMLLAEVYIWHNTKSGLIIPYGVPVWPDRAQPCATARAAVGCSCGLHGSCNDVQA